MKNSIIWRLRLDTRGQDLIEYALMAGFIAVAAGAIVHGVAESVRHVFLAVANIFAAGAEIRVFSPGISMIRLVCAVLALFFLGLIIWRRKKSEMDDD